MKRQKRDIDFYQSGLYREIFYRAGISSWATKKMHLKLERFASEKRFSTTLEIGGGEGFHFDFVKENYDLYILSDIEKRPLSKFAKERQEVGSLEQITMDAHELQFATSSIDRVIMMCVLHHLKDPELALREARRVLKDGGLLSIYLPHDPSALYRIVRKILLWKTTKKLGIDYALINAREHKNHCYGIKIFLSREFLKDEIKVKRFPLNLPHSLSFFSCYQINIKK